MQWLKRICDETVPLSKYGEEATSWATCAIGEARKASLSVAVPALGEGGLPDDEVLFHKGLHFGYAVVGGDRKAALGSYLAIQQRIADLVLKGKKRGK